MEVSLLTGTNPVLGRELRVALRTARTFMLLALYVAILGAIVVSQFPSDTALMIERSGAVLSDEPGMSAAQRGQALFWNFCQAQALLVVILFPALATGMLAQERERRTLEPLLLTPLTPMQIVWGKAGGVLSLAVLLLLSTLPLTSLCFLLGGVSPGELISAYAALLGLALVTISIGLYCSARWTNTTHATVACYGMLPFLLAVICLFAGIATFLSGLYLTLGAFYKLYVLWKHWSTKPLPRRLGVAWWLLFSGLLIWLCVNLLILMANNKDFAVIVIFALSLTTYLVYVAHWGLQQAAREVAKRPDPQAPLPERLHDLKGEWQRAVAPPPVIYLPAPSGGQIYTPQPQAATPPPKALPATYGVQPFLPDNWNPILARDLRAGLVGKFAYLMRFSYIAVIGTELLLLFILLLQPDIAEENVLGWFSGWAKLHLMLLITAGAWLGARAIAPEREQQTLPQLLTTPLSAPIIVQGKMMAVMIHTFYIFVMGVPLALFLPGLHLIPWSMAVAFILLELAFGATAAAWGLFCSVHGFTVRRSLGLALGGVLLLVMCDVLLNVLMTEFGNLMLPLFPFRVMQAALTAAGKMVWFGPGNGIQLSAGNSFILTLITLCLYSVGTLILLFLTARAFKHYAQTV